MKEKLEEINGEIYNISIMVGDFSTPYSVMDRTIRHKINKEMENLKNPINQLDLIDVDTISHLTTKEYVLFSCAYSKFSRIDYMLCYNKLQ